MCGMQASRKARIAAAPLVSNCEWQSKQTTSPVWQAMIASTSFSRKALAQRSISARISAVVFAAAAPLSVCTFM